jgi:hypothetical protein
MYTQWARHSVGVGVVASVGVFVIIGLTVVVAGKHGIIELIISGMMQTLVCVGDGSGVNVCVGVCVSEGD